MKLYIVNHKFHYEMENLTRLFFPDEKLLIIKTEQVPDDTDDCIITAVDKSISVSMSVGGRNSEKTCELSCDNDKNELQMALLLYELLCEFFNTTQPWGILTGVRPIKLLRRLIDDTSKEQARDYFENTLMVSKEKTNLALVCEQNERKIISLSEQRSFSLYISIPFCPSRCAYCSFVSQSIEKAQHLVKDYVPLLCREIEITAQIAAQLSLTLESVYIGGGTPTTLSDADLSKIVGVINNHFDMKNCREFTVEAGRPDTVTKEKLCALKEGKVTRISINPQTMSDSVLSAIGRRHSAQQTIDAYYLARECGFDNINMDLIAGLLTDTYESFKSSLDKVMSLSPESVTVHSLAMKRSSTLSYEGKRPDDTLAKSAVKMLAYAQNTLTQGGYIPYYLYRQSHMVGNCENVGWSKKGFECLYNVYVMDETHTVLSCGAGGVTKLKSPFSNYLKRIFNFKYPYEYNSRFDELIERKAEIGAFYKQIFNNDKID